MMNQPSCSRNERVEQHDEEGRGRERLGQSARAAQRGRARGRRSRRGQGEAALEEGHEPADVELAPAELLHVVEPYSPPRLVRDEVAAEAAAEDQLLGLERARGTSPTSPKRSFSQVNMPAAPPL